MLIDSHCHLDRLDLKRYDGSLDRLMAETRADGVGHMLCVSIDLEDYPQMRALVDPYPEVSVSVGVHPNERHRREPSAEELAELAADPRNVAIGETGLDYYRSEGDLEWQRARFRTHIAAARACGKPLIVHTRDARDDTIRILHEEGAKSAGGVLHCFTESWEMAKQALELGFYISFSGIVTFNNADDLRKVAAQVPLDRLLIETDAPYLTPVPHRGRPNEPRFVTHVAGCIAAVRNRDRDEVVAASGKNFFRLFRAAERAAGADAAASAVRSHDSAG
jgi:TatD DNase family protein